MDQIVNLAMFTMDRTVTQSQPASSTAAECYRADMLYDRRKSSSYLHSIRLKRCIRLLVLQLVNSFCKPHLLYATECLQLSHTAIIKLKSAWFCALSKIFHVKGNDVDFISEMCERYCFETEVTNRQDRFCRKLAMMNSPLFIPFINSND